MDPYSSYYGSPYANQYGNFSNNLGSNYGNAYSNPSANLFSSPYNSLYGNTNHSAGSNTNSYNNPYSAYAINGNTNGDPYSNYASMGNTSVDPNVAYMSGFDHSYGSMFGNVFGSMGADLNYADQVLHKTAFVTQSRQGNADYYEKVGMQNAYKKAAQRNQLYAQGYTPEQATQVLSGKFAGGFGGFGGGGFGATGATANPGGFDVTSDDQFWSSILNRGQQAQPAAANNSSPLLQLFSGLLGSDGGQSIVKMLTSFLNK